jgi:predicted nucleic-acid-binding protein
MNRTAIKLGLSVLDAGGDFADGVIAYDGDWLGAEEFVSFDSKAVSLILQSPAAGKEQFTARTSNLPNEPN